MSLKTLVGILQVAIQKRIKETEELEQMHEVKTSSFMPYYHEGYKDACEAILMELEIVEKRIQEEP